MIDIAPETSPAGFNFDNCLRNSILQSKGFDTPKATKTGTTIVGIVFKDGVILGADTRATGGNIVSDKNCAKIHYLTKNMYCCGAGTAADTEQTTLKVSSTLLLHGLNTGRVVPVPAANALLKQMLFRYQGHISAALILGGVDNTGSYVYSIHPHGSSDHLPYTTMGSGSLAAMSMFERSWRPDLTEEEGRKLISDAISAGIFNDLGSGSNIDMCVITKDGAKYLRNVEMPNEKERRQEVELRYKYPAGTTAVLETKSDRFVVTEEVQMIVD